MSTRIFSLSLGALLVLTACAPESGAPEGVSVECGFAKSASLSADCVLENAGEGVFTIHHPDATFQRFRYDAARFGVTALDGVDEVRDITLNTPAGSGMLEFTFRNARYRLDPSRIDAGSNE